MPGWKLRDINGHQIYVANPEKKGECVFVGEKKSELFSQNIALLFETGFKGQVTTGFVCNMLTLLTMCRPN
jgi:hypothetical protein